MGECQRVSFVYSYFASFLRESSSASYLDGTTCSQEKCKKIQMHAGGWYRRGGMLHYVT